jgi:hypothetical protein
LVPTRLFQTGTIGTIGTKHWNQTLEPNIGTKHWNQTLEPNLNEDKSKILKVKNKK